VTPITDFGTAVMTGIAAAFAALFSALPSVIGAILLLIVGWIIAGILGGLVVGAARVGVTSFLARAQVHADPAGVVGGVVKWYVRLVFVLLAANAVGLTAVSTIVNSILAFIPNLLVAVVILGAFAWLAGIARNVVAGALQGRIPNAGALAAITYAAVFAFGAMAAANQLGVASSLINILFTGVVAALALAFGLAFGLGGREEAAAILRDVRSSATRAIEQPGNGALDMRAADLRRRDEVMRSS
jgi:hypothetical protein